MSFNPFATAGSYADMLNKIATCTFVIALVGVWMLRTVVPPVDQALGQLKIDVELGGVTVPFGTILPSVIFALLARIIKLHDRVSDLFRIRLRFDVADILLPMAIGSGVTLDMDQVRRLQAERGRLMGATFYKYVSSNEGKTKIDPHYVTMALDQWSWYWVVIEALCVSLVLVGVLAAYERFGWALVCMSVFLAGLWTLQPLRSACAKYALDEVREVLSDNKRRQEVAGVFRALPK